MTTARLDLATGKWSAANPDRPVCPEDGTLLDKQGKCSSCDYVTTPEKRAEAIHDMVDYGLRGAPEDVKKARAGGSS